MNERTIEIYKALYGSLECTKENLANYLKLSSVKTVENNIKEIEDIEYDITIRKYRFKNLLPKYIPNEVFFETFKDSITNKLMKNDFALLEKHISSINTMSMIHTSELSNLAKKIIMFKNAIKNNCVLKVSYKKNDGITEEKFIQPNTIHANGFTYYCFVTYDQRNEKDVGAQRTFAFNGIQDIEAVEYTSGFPFSKEQKGNAFGSFKKDRFVILHLNQGIAHFFKRENLFSDDAFELIDEELNGSITVKMYYNNDFEIEKIIQQWMPNITIQNNLELKNKVYKKINDNFNQLINGK